MQTFPFPQNNQSIVHHTYPNFEQNYHNEDFLQCRTILARTIETIDVINQYVSGLISRINIFTCFVLLDVCTYR